MPSLNSKTGNYLQPLGESHSTQNQAFYFALLAIKNAFSLDETRNLQKLRKRRNNTAWYFAQLGNKARKIQSMTAPQELSLTKKAGITFGVPAVLMFALASNAFGNDNGTPIKVAAAPGITLHQPEGSGTSVKPAAHVPPQKEITPTEKYCGADGLCSKEEARLASAEGFIVLRHGPGVEDYVRNAIGYLNSRGYPSIAVPGDPIALTNLVELHVLGMTYEKQLFTDKELFAGNFSRKAKGAFDYLKKQQVSMMDHDR